MNLFQSGTVVVISVFDYRWLGGDRTYSCDEEDDSCDDDDDDDGAGAGAGYGDGDGGFDDGGGDDCNDYDNVLASAGLCVCLMSVE